MQPSSPAIDSGTNSPPGGTGLGGQDLDGNVRVQDIDGDGNAICNMGAYEEPENAPLSTFFGGGGGGCFISTVVY